MKIKTIVEFNPAPASPIARRSEIDYIDTAAVVEGRLGDVQHLSKMFPSRAQREIHTNDILISSVRPNLKHNYFVDESTDGMIASSGFIHIRVKKSSDVSPRFLYYYLTSPAQVHRYVKIADSSQSAYPSFNKDVVEDIELPTIDLPTQLRIAGILGSLDEKIELNRKKVAELEALAKTIYDYWFVQFDFPDKNGKPYRSSGGKMVWNEQLKREIPAGWEVKPLEKACKRIQSGGTPESNNEAFYSGDIPWFTTQELIDSWVFCSNRSITKSALENSAAKLFPPDTVLLAIYAAPTVGRLAILAKESAFNQACCGFVVGDDISKEYLFLFLYENRNKLNSIADGTAQKNLSVGKMRMFDVLIPTGEIMTLWRNIAEPLFDAIRTDSETAHILSRQRDALLPLLMNKQVSVGELK